ncbi:sensor histidine kinase [Taibaiella soli]|uniref:sensor histidine kinase n=1 Tax=Taibaiella soli TaxID=1649169 RepID=UPI000F4E2345|nr:HAMP domain-containing sensor histidine kinase [Taibaiella soli]
MGSGYSWAGSGAATIAITNCFPKTTTVPHRTKSFRITSPRTYIRERKFIFHICCYILLIILIYYITIVASVALAHTAAHRIIMMIMPMLLIIATVSYIFIVTNKDVNQNAEKQAEIAELATEKLNVITADRNLFYSYIHDLQHPLQQLFSYLNLLEKDPERFQNVTPQLKNVSTQLLSTTLRLLEATTQGESIRELLKEESLQITDWYHSLTDYTYQLAQQRKVLFTAQISDDVPVYMLADPEKLTRLLHNILDNAIRHTPPGKSVSLHCFVSGKELFFQITDEGCGIEPEQLNLLNQPLTGTFKGGLSIARHIINQMDGRMNISSTEQKGTTVLVCLPIRQ